MSTWDRGSARVHFVVKLAHDLVVPHALVPELFVLGLVNALALEKAADVIAALNFDGQVALLDHELEGIALFLQRQVDHVVAAR